MDNEINHQKKFAVDVVKKLREAGYESLWAGGCVRDQLLGRQPKDYDVATDATPEQVREVFGKNRTLPIGAAFGVITVLGTKAEGQIEIATFRVDGGYSDGRRPDSVHYSTAEEDAKRRDFTINGIFFDPLENRVIDYVGGQNDLDNKLIRAIGNAEDRIAEDKLRMLRGVRFAGTYEFELEYETFQAIAKHADWITQVSGERIAAELHRMFAHPKRGLAARYLVQSGLAQAIFQSELLDLKQLDSSSELAGWIRSSRFAPAMAAFLIPVLKIDWSNSTEEKQLRQLIHDWKFSNEDNKEILWLLKSYPTLLSARDESWPQVQRCLVHQWGAGLLEVAKAISEYEHNHYQVNLDYCRQKLALPPQQLNPEPLLDGQDLIAAGYKPGPRFKAVLDTIRDEQLQGKLHTQVEALRQANLMLQPDPS